MSIVRAIASAFLMGGLVVTEQVFSLNGLGKLCVASVANQHYNMTQALVMLVVAVAVANLLVDVLFASTDPHIRYTP
jgi:peptide/nickel transport system permease protein